MGIQDAFNLAWKLSLVLRNGANPRLLDSYEAERKPIDEAVIRQTDRATRLISLHGSLTRFVRDHLMSLLTQIPAVAEKIGEGLSGLAVDYRHSPTVENHATGSVGVAAGDRAPDAVLARADSGAALRLYDLFAEHRHALLLWGDLPTPALSRLPAFPQSDLAVHRIAASGTANGGELVDRAGEVAARYGPDPAVYLIRPDGYVAFRADASAVSTHLPPYLTHFFAAA